MEAQDLLSHDFVKLTPEEFSHKYLQAQTRLSHFDESISQTTERLTTVLELLASFKAGVTEHEVELKLALFNVCKQAQLVIGWYLSQDLFVGKDP